MEIFAGQPYRHGMVTIFSAVVRSSPSFFAAAPRQIVRYEIALLGSAMPAAEEQPSVSDMLVKLLQPTGNELCHRCLSPSSEVIFESCQRCIRKFICSPDGIMLAFKSPMIHSEPPTTSATMSTPNASASTLLVLSGPVPMCRKNTK